MRIKLIDVSEHNGRIDWAKVKADGVKGAILRCGYGQDRTDQDDKQWKRNAAECKRLGIPFGVYLYSYAKTLTAARSEANHVLRLIQGMKLDYPVYYDLEDAGTTGKCSNAQIGAMAQAFYEIITRAGFRCGIYANTYWWNHKLTTGFFDKVTDRWVAQYATRCTYGGKYQIWQYSSNGRVNGISGRVDMNWCYVDYPAMLGGSKASGSGSDKAVKGKVKIVGSTKEGMKGVQVKGLQEMLKGYGYYSGSIDGAFGPKTLAGVKAFQKAEGLTVDGIAGPKTWSRLAGLS